MQDWGICLNQSVVGCEPAGQDSDMAVPVVDGAAATLTVAVASSADQCCIRCVL